MGDIRKVIVNGEEFEVELEQDGEIGLQRLKVKPSKSEFQMQALLQSREDLCGGKSKIRQS